MFVVKDIKGQSRDLSFAHESTYDVEKIIDFSNQKSIFARFAGLIFLIKSLFSHDLQVQ
jgi:hypothetical protein